jgi:hypothetical protein
MEYEYKGAYGYLDNHLDSLLSGYVLVSVYKDVFY